jgi:hypothetical protein
MMPFAICPGAGNYVADNTDCDDTRNYVFPGAPEQCNNLNSDCNAATPVDFGCDDDGDDYCDNTMRWYPATLACPNTTVGPMGNDCNDNGPFANTQYPGNAEVCTGGRDEDCDGLTDCADTADCSANPACAVSEICNDAVDNDGDACIDLADSNCGGVENNCSDSSDNDCDGSTDSADSDCPACCTFNMTLPCSLCSGTAPASPPVPPALPPTCC